MDWMKQAAGSVWDWTSNLLGGTDYGDLVKGAKFAMSYFDDDDEAGTFGSSSGGLVNLSGKVKTSITKPRSATANKIAKSPITSQAEAAVAKHRAMLARAINQAQGITSKSKRT
jgi:hypothetical protein